ncbi:TraY domain-containing protein [Thaumasiovibrio subtropicus]|uniref:TraY domain-containing protein n=1 Tax=Thaumasiovibrio subtropicus TaxID=1891207 RepID=UPI000B3583B1|nr:TraY domain-containing protein [Thaumasiovibrio subtropicus]
MNITLRIDSTTNQKLSVSSESSGRSKKMEAKNRVLDYIARFSRWDKTSIQSVDGSYSHVSFDLNIEENKLLNHFFSVNKKGMGVTRKTDAAALILQQHLSLFPDAPTYGDRE